ncbi:hypothetical protein [Paenibacillus sp. GYB003]|uniref:hypothetical protein n=1 Tax=Paenibacillus sp. GYB003 TaxID=2994392 RepID=UPI002F96D561
MERIVVCLSAEKAIVFQANESGYRYKPKMEENDPPSTALRHPAACGCPNRWPSTIVTVPMAVARLPSRGMAIKANHRPAALEVVVAVLRLNQDNANSPAAESIPVPYS